MVDSVSPARRSEIMRAVRSSNTKPELAVRRALWSAGFRYGRSRARKLPGSPDLVFPALKAVVFVHGCFWHGHNCSLARVPKSNREFWVEKVRTNRARDARVTRKLRRMGWHAYVVWECSLASSTARVARRLGRLREAAQSPHRSDAI